MKRMAAGLLAAAAMVTFGLPAGLRAEPPRPAWVDRFPHDPDRYIGIGRVDKRIHPDDFRERALASALAQISREISVEITAVNSATRTENSGGAEETYADRVAATTRNALTGYALEAVYETGEGFWAWYALDKETWERAQAEKSRGLADAVDRGLTEVQAVLEAGRIQYAGERLIEVRKDFARALAADAILRDRSRRPADRLATQSAKLRMALRFTRLVLSPGPWIFSLPANSHHYPHPYPHPFPHLSPLPATIVEASGIPGSGARAVLHDSSGDRTWSGPLTLRISEWPDKAGGGWPANAASECRVETDAAGRLDLAIPFQACGLASGTWRVTWTIPGPGSDNGLDDDFKERELHAVTIAEWRPADVTLAIKQDPVPQESAGQATDADLRSVLPALRAALEGWRSRRYRITSDNPSAIPTAIPSGKPSHHGNGQTLEVRIREVTLDTLEGMCFASIRASLVFPGRPGAVEARGKAGHADRGRALRRAAADFAREAALAADQSGAGRPANPIPLR